RGVFDPGFDMFDLLPKTVGVRETEIAAHSRAADVEPLSRAATFEAGEIFGRRLREVITRQFDGVHRPCRREVDELFERHRRGVSREVERLAKAVRGDTESHARGPFATNRLDGGDGGDASGGEDGRQKCAARWRLHGKAHLKRWARIE